MSDGENFNNTSPKTLHRARRFLEPMTNLIKISFESKTAGKILLETKLREKYTFHQQHETIDFFGLLFFFVNYFVSLYNLINKFIILSHY